jgi:hypothetical protein
METVRDISNGVGIETRIRCTMQREHIPNAPQGLRQYLLTMSIWPEHGSEQGGDIRAAYPQAFGVVNDFGDIVIVSRWN